MKKNHILKKPVTLLPFQIFIIPHSYLLQCYMVYGNKTEKIRKTVLHQKFFSSVLTRNKRTVFSLCITFFCVWSSFNQLSEFILFFLSYFLIWSMGRVKNLKLRHIRHYLSILLGLEEKTYELLPWNWQGKQRFVAYIYS